ncbi:MAG: hypothetical protein K0R78_1435 [Pelosinus sp.]|jgi:hypothetical protein|nr:hypothetical protein [Pelosinus sp.]
MIDIDMPITVASNVMENIQGWSTELKIPDLSHVIAVLKETWNLQTFKNLEQGKVAISDDIINEYLATAIEDSEEVKELSITSLENHQLKITALTKKAGHMVFLCRVERFEHNKQYSVMKLKVVDKKLPDKPIVSWIFSKVSLAMVTKLVGNVDPGHGLGLKIKGNEVNIDFHQALYNSNLGTIDVLGYKPLDAVIVREAMPEKGFVNFTTAVDLPDHIKEMIKNVLSDSI